MASAVARLNDHGQSPWYDNVGRPIIVNGELARMIKDDGIRGGTSNPTIFEQAIAGSDVYDEQLAGLVGEGRDATDTYWELLLTDIDKAAQTFRAVHEEHGGGDGFVSIEVDPRLARDTQGTVAQARWLHDRLSHPNVMVKIPGTGEGLPAIEETLAEGNSVNVTLIFSLERYGEVIEAYFRGLERLAEAGGDLSAVASVASFFVSRVDTEVDRRLPDDHPLRGKAAVANAKLAYRLFRERFRGERWLTLAQKGARLQRPLWASTSTKNPDYPDTLYVDPLVGPDTVNTLADATLDALRDHGDPRPGTVEEGFDEAEQVFRDLAEAGVDLDEVTRVLEEEGIDKFAASFVDAITTIDKQRAEVA